MSSIHVHCPEDDPDHIHLVGTNDGATPDGVLRIPAIAEAVMDLVRALIEACDDGLETTIDCDAYGARREGGDIGD